MPCERLQAIENSSKSGGKTRYDSRYPQRSATPMYTQQFLDKPLAFAKLHTLYPYADPPVNDQHIKELSLEGGTKFGQIQGQNKVAFCDIQRATSFDSVPGDFYDDYEKDR